MFIKKVSYRDSVKGIIYEIDMPPEGVAARIDITKEKHSNSEYYVSAYFRNKKDMVQYATIKRWNKKDILDQMLIMLSKMANIIGDKITFLMLNNDY